MMYFHSHQSKNSPADPPQYATWAILEPGNLPPEAFADRALGSIVPSSGLYEPTSGVLLPFKKETLDGIFTELDIVPYEAKDGGAWKFVNNAKTEIKPKLSQILDLRAYKSNDMTYILETQNIVTKTFPNPQRVLDKFKKNTETITELNKVLEVEGVAHMIIGLKMFEDARLQYSIERNGALQLGSEIPIDKILLALGSPSIPLEGLSTSVKLERIREYVAHQQAHGKRVFALKFMRIMKAKRWKETQEVESGGVQTFTYGLQTIDSQTDRVDDDDLVLCPMGELPDGMNTL